MIACLLLLTTYAYAQEKVGKMFDDPELKAEMEKMTPAEREKAAMFMLMMMEAEAGVQKKIYYRSVSPSIVSTGKEGLKFSTRVPFLGVAQENWYFTDYKENPLIRKPDYMFERVISHCGGCFRAMKFKDNRLTFTHYPAGSEFVIESFIGVPGHISTIIRDPMGKRIELNEYDFRESIDGGNGGLQNQELVLLDIINNNTDVANIPVKIENLDLEYLQKGNKENWDFPPFKATTQPTFAADDYESWLTYAATGFLESPAKVKIQNIRKTEYDTVFDISTSMRTFVLLHYVGLITPFIKIEDHGAFDTKYRNRWKNQTSFILGQDAKSFLEKWKSTIKAPPMPEGEERKKIADQLHKEAEARIKARIEEEKKKK